MSALYEESEQPVTELKQGNQKIVTPPPDHPTPNQKGLSISWVSWRSRTAGAHHVLADSLVFLQSPFYLSCAYES
jgi:hypothetical protein